MDRLKDIPLFKWKDLSIDFYKSSLVEVKERFVHHQEENVSITQKAIQLLTILIPFCTGSIVYIVSKKPSALLILALIGLYGYTIYLTFGLLKKHPIKAPGSTPEYFLTKEFDTNLSKEEKDLLLHYNLIEMYWGKSNSMAELNANRMQQYDTAIILAIVSFLATGLFIGALI